MDQTKNTSRLAGFIFVVMIAGIARCGKVMRGGGLGVYQWETAANGP